MSGEDGRPPLRVLPDAEGAEGGGPARPAVGDRPTVTRDRRERSDPHDPPVQEVRRLRPAEVHNAPPGRRAPARDAAARHGAHAPTTFDFATGKERAAEGPAARVLPPSRTSPPPSAPPDVVDAWRRPSGGEATPAEAPRTVALKGRAPRPAPGGPGPGGPGGGAAAPAEARRAPGAPQRLGVPVPVRVQSGAGGRPVRIEGDVVDAVRESWLIEDRWWTDRPLRRRYWEAVTTSGKNSIVFRDLVDGRWYRQR